jgi:diadenosine tetraphosphate (Ap4A) HIT family hydrolase
MFYNDYLKENKPCPFCSLKKEEIFDLNKSANLILSRAPYTKDHMLVVPKQHKSFMEELTLKERQEVEELILKALKKIHKKHSNVSVLYREGKKDEVGKSIEHMHFHLIPDLLIGAVDINLDKRIFYSEKEYLKKINELKKQFK